MTLCAQHTTRRDSGVRYGFTLIELILSLIVTTILLAAMGSIMVLSARALDNGKGPSALAITASDVMEEIAQDVNLAISFSERSDPGKIPVVLDFTVPDRNGDLAPETIRYEWSGVSGAPLTRRYNGGAVVNVVDDVREFSLSYLTRFRKGAAPPPPPPPQESSEVVLMSYDTTTGGSLKEFNTDEDEWPSQYVKPTLPKNTVSWKITRVQLRLRRNTGASKNYDVEIRTATAALAPSSTILETRRYDTVALSISFQWQTYPFSQVNSLDPASGVCVVVTNPFYATKHPIVQYHDNGSGMPSNTHWITTNNYGSTWTTPDSKLDTQFYVYGTYTTSGPPQW